MQFSRLSRQVGLALLVSLSLIIGISPSPASASAGLWERLAARVAARLAAKHAKTVAVEPGKGTASALGTGVVTATAGAYLYARGQTQTSIQTKPMPITDKRWRPYTTANFCSVPETAGQTVCEPCDLNGITGACPFRHVPPIEFECSAPLACVPLQVAVEERLAEKQRRKEMLRSMLLGQIKVRPQIDRGHICTSPAGAGPEEPPETEEGETADLPIISSRAVTNTGPSSQTSDAFARYFSD